MATQQGTTNQALRSGKALAEAGLTARIAGNSYGEPVCLHPASYTDEGLGLTVYMAGGIIVGVCISDAEKGVVAEYGLTPTGNEED